MKFETVFKEDFDQIKLLQPEGWPDIIESFQFYLDNDYCYPFKVILDKKIVGLGASILFKNTAWLAHIIVGENYRNKGIGYKITEFLVDDLKKKSIDTILLIATKMGEPVYKKLGFKVISNYLSLNREKAWNETVTSEKIIPYQEHHHTEILELDKEVTGENRECILREHLPKSKVYKDNESLKGFYIPCLGEGLLVANDPKAGLELLKLKHAKIDKVVLPEENKAGINFLLKNGFSKPEIKGKKMVLGKGISWKPECYYSRIGGNVG